MESWYECRLVVAAEAEDAATAALFELGTNGVRCERDGDDALLLAAFRTAPAEAEVRQACAAFGVAVLDLAVQRLGDADVDWSENWKLHFQPRAVGERFHVCPPWAPEAPPGRIALVVNPGMAFGTGQHATTRGCLVLLERACAGGSVRTGADLGTGSGILAIAMAKLGVARVFAVDNDPEARASTRASVIDNDVAAAVVVGDDIEAIPSGIDLFVANLFADLLVALAEGIAGRCAPDATIVCSGMLEQDGPRVVARFAELGWAPAATQVESPWYSVALRRSAA